MRTWADKQVQKLVYTTLSLPMLEAFAGAVPSPKARDLADWARMTWLDLKDGNEA
jgi:hypothetical protein